MPGQDPDICLVLTVTFHNVDISLAVFFKHTISYCMTYFIIDFICCFRHIVLCLPGTDMYSLCKQWVMLYHMIAHSASTRSITALPFLSSEITGLIHTYLFFEGLLLCVAE